MIKFDDDEEEIWNQDNYDEYLFEESIPVEGVDFRFINKFKSSLFFNGCVISIDHNWKIKCKHDEDGQVNVNAKK